MNEREIQRKIAELRSIAEKERLDIHADLNRLQAKFAGGPAGVDDVPDAWRRVELARHPDRPTCLNYISMISDEFLELHGDRLHSDDTAMVGGIARIGGVAFTFVGNQKGNNMKENLRRNYGMSHPDGYRKALRLAKQAERFGRPIVTFIDTPGAYPGVASEERGISEAIAHNLKEFSILRTPVICFVIGEGGSGGALGIGVGDRVFMLENTVYSVISPEGCASILLRDAKKAKLAASLMKMTSFDIHAFGIVDGIIPEPPGGAHTDAAYTAGKVKQQLLRSYEELADRKVDVLVRERSRKILSHGLFVEQSEPRRSFAQRFLGKK